ncbi:MAG: ferredoxin reductase family protein [Solirubrobacteraceae bacterium]
MTSPGRLLARWAPALLALANGLIVVSLWWRAGGLREIDDTASALTGIGRLCGLLGAYLVLVEVLLLARIPLLDRTVGFDRLTVWHRRNGKVALSLLIVLAAAITTGYALGDGVSFPAEAGRLLSGYPGVITALAGLVTLIAVVVSSLVIVRRRLRYETWYFVHLYTYLAIALAFSHQIATGREFVGDPAARAYWQALYLATLAGVVVFRIGVPALRNARHRLRVERVIEEAPGVVSLEIGGAQLERLKARAGQFFSWRFLTREHWWQSHPYSLSAAPDGRRLRITVKEVGDFSAGLKAIRPGTRVIFDGPHGAFTAAARRRPRVALIAGGVGITPIRALLEDLPGDPGDITLVYRAVREDDVILRAELEELAQRRGVEVHYVLGDHRGPGAAALLSAEHLALLVPDIALRDVYVCGPPAMADATGASLRRAGVPRRQVITERFAL